MNFISTFLKISFLSILVAAFILPFSTLASTSILMSPVKINVTAGETFNVDINVDPNGLANYTIKTTLNFPADLISLSKWKYASTWEPIRQVGYDYFNNKTGKIIRTATYLGGFSDRTKFATMTFVAKKSGSGEIVFDGDMLALDEKSANQYKSANLVELVVSPGIMSPETAPLSSEIPIQLINPKSVPPADSATDLVPPVTAPESQPATPPVDVGITINEKSVTNISKLIAKIKFISFSTERTPAKMLFEILDNSGNIVRSEQENTNAVVGLIYNKTFTKKNFPSGQYVLRVTVVANGTSHIFTQGFNIVTPRNYLAGPTLDELMFILKAFIACVPVIVILVIFLVFVRRKTRKHGKRKS